MKKLINIITTTTAVLFLANMVSMIPVTAKYKQAFAGETICLTEKLSLLDYLKLGTKEGFVKYGH